MFNRKNKLKWVKDKMIEFIGLKKRIEDIDFIHESTYLGFEVSDVFKVKYKYSKFISKIKIKSKLNGKYTQRHYNDVYLNEINKGTIIDIFNNEYRAFAYKYKEQIDNIKKINRG